LEGCVSRQALSAEKACRDSALNEAAGAAAEVVTAASCLERIEVSEPNPSDSRLSDGPLRRVMIETPNPFGRPAVQIPSRVFDNHINSSLRRL
jgi:hypothetical protein